MLGRLVNKFQQHSLSDEQSPSDNIDSVDALNDFRQNLIPSVLYPSNLNDSGTESENEEELEQLETSYLMSIAADQAHLGPSPPVLTSSPPLISEFDTNSWDSTGCESGIVVHEQSEEPNDSLVDCLVQQQPVNLQNTILYPEVTGDNEVAVSAGGRTAINSGDFEAASFSIKHGAFRPFRRRAKEQDNDVASNDVTSTPAIQGVIGEKRRYDNIISKPYFIGTQISAENFSRNSTGGSGIPRETLVACRRTPVKLIIYNPDGLKQNASRPVVVPTRNGSVVESQGESPPFRPIKRGRLNTFERPSLDFEKMRKRMMTDWSKFQVSEFCESGKKEETQVDTPATPNVSRCSQHKTVGCRNNECVFYPLALDKQPGCSFLSN